jgi:hypothetical protein
MDPDTGGPKTHGSGSATLYGTYILLQFTEVPVYIVFILLVSVKGVKIFNILYSLLKFSGKMYSLAYYLDWVVMEMGMPIEI